MKASQLMGEAAACIDLHPMRMHDNCLHADVSYLEPLDAGRSCCFGQMWVDFHLPPGASRPFMQGDWHNRILICRCLLHRIHIKSTIAIIFEIGFCAICCRAAIHCWPNPTAAVRIVYHYMYF
jgi:hypothetical protein